MQSNQFTCQITNPVYIQFLCEMNTYCATKWDFYAPPSDDNRNNDKYFKSFQKKLSKLTPQSTRLTLVDGEITALLAVLCIEYSHLTKRRTMLNEFSKSKGNFFQRLIARIMFYLFLRKNSKNLTTELRNNWIKNAAPLSRELIAATRNNDTCVEGYKEVFGQSINTASKIRLPHNKIILKLPLDNQLKQVFLFFKHFIIFADKHCQQSVFLTDLLSNTLMNDADLTWFGELAVSVDKKSIELSERDLAIFYLGLSIIQAFFISDAAKLVKKFAKTHTDLTPKLQKDILHFTNIHLTKIEEFAKDNVALQNEMNRIKTWRLE